MISGKIIGGIILIIIGTVFSVGSIFIIIMMAYYQVPTSFSQLSGFRLVVAGIVGAIAGPLLIFVGIKSSIFQYKWNRWNKEMNEK